MVLRARELKKETIVEKLYRKVESNEFTYNNWIQTIDELLFANIDVTSTVMAWSLTEIGANYEEQEKLRREINEILRLSDLDEESPQSQKNEINEEIKAYVKRTDTFLHMCLLEILRLHPLLWFSFPEQSSQKITIDGYVISPNTPIVIDQYSVNYKSPIWNPEDKPKNFGSMFSPCRFENISLREALYSQVTFGPGPRKCLGRNFAEILIKTEIVYVLLNYRIEISKSVDYSQNTFVVQPVTEIKFRKI